VLTAGDSIGRRVVRVGLTCLGLYATVTCTAIYTQEEDLAEVAGGIEGARGGKHSAENKLAIGVVSAAMIAVTLALAAGPDGATNSRHARFAKGVNKAGIEEEEHETDS
jgi:hypothetical protein